MGSFLDEKSENKTSCSSTGTTNSINVNVTNKDVLEVGCGCGLAGIVAGVHGARTVTLTDCDDRALVLTGSHLKELTSQKTAGLCEHTFRLRHHLWEQDEADNRNVDVEVEVQVEEEVRHW